MKKDVNYNFMWIDAYETLEVAFDGDDITKNLYKVMEKVASFTAAEDIQIYKYDKKTSKLDEYKSLNNSERVIVGTYYNFENDDIANYNLISNSNTLVSFSTIETDSSKYIIVLKNNNALDEAINDQYMRIIERIFKLIFEKIEDNKEKKDAYDKLSAAYQKVKEAYVTDALTGIGNRTGYSMLTDEMFKDGKRNVTFSLADLFRLKFVNDQLGHLYGDKYIISAAKALEDVIDEDDKLFRIGGDEFVIISMPHKLEVMKAKFEKANFVLSKENFNSDKITFPLALNFGIVDGEGTLDELYLKADKELKLNKDETYKVLRLDRRR